MIVIEGKGYKMEKIIDSAFYNLSLLKKVNAGKENEREEFKIVSYGIPFETCIKQIVDYRLRNMEGVFTIREYLDYYKELVDELDKDFE